VTASMLSAVRRAGAAGEAVASSSERPTDERVAEAVRETLAAAPLTPKVFFFSLQLSTYLSLQLSTARSLTLYLSLSNSPPLFL